MIIMINVLSFAYSHKVGEGGRGRGGDHGHTEYYLKIFFGLPKATFLIVKMMLIKCKYRVF